MATATTGISSAASGQNDYGAINPTDDEEPAPATATEELKSEEQDPESNANVTVAVTGASGFIAAHCIKQLLEKGYTVRGTVRGDPSSERYAWLYELTTRFSLPRKVELFQADLLQPGSFKQCFTGCDYIFHVASPFKIEIEDPIKDLVEPAKQGTLNVLQCAKEAASETLKRIVVTSSVASINGLSDPKKIYTEADWNKESTVENGPYSFSKTEAEHAAWQWMSAEESAISFDLVTVNPALVLGRHLNDGLSYAQLNESNAVLTRIINGEFPIRLNVAFTLVDVRDVAAAHIFMIEGEAAQSAKGRHICANLYCPLGVMMDICEEYCAQRKVAQKIPCCPCDCDCCWCFVMCVACCMPKGERQYLRGAVNRGTHYSNEKLKGMGFEFRDNDSTMVYTLDYLREAGFIGK